MSQKVEYIEYTAYIGFIVIYNEAGNINSYIKCDKCQTRCLFYVECWVLENYFRSIIVIYDETGNTICQKCCKNLQVIVVYWWNNTTFLYLKKEGVAIKEVIENFNVNL